VVDPNGGTHSRSESDAMRNTANVRFRGSVTEVFGLEVGWNNNWINYTDDNVPAGRSALLDRVENLLHLDARYLAQEDLTAIVGYQFGLTRYTGDSPIRSPLFEPNPPKGDIKDNNSHYFYVGAEHQFSRQLLGKLKVGAQYTDYDNVNDSQWSPYLEIGGTYTYLPGSFVQFGIRHARNATDASSLVPGSGITLDQESTYLYGSISHRITPQLQGSIIGQFQNGVFNGGVYDDTVDNFYAFGINLQYKINVNWSAEAGYNFDRLDSDQPELPRSFSRNRVYVGVRAAF